MRVLVSLAFVATWLCSNAAFADLVVGADGALGYTDKKGTSGFKLAVRGIDTPEVKTFSVERVGNYVALIDYTNFGGDGWLTVFPIGKIEAGNKVTLFDGFSSEAGSRTPVINWKNTTYPSTSDFPMEKLNP